MNRTNYAQIFVSARSVRRIRNSSVGRTWTVSDCKWMCVEGGLCVILSFERFIKFPAHNCASVCVIHESACVVYASSVRDYASAISAYASELVRNHARPLTPHLHITHEPRTYHVHSTDNVDSESACSWNVHEACVFGRAPSVIHVSGVRRMFVEYFGQLLDAQARTNPICA